MTSKIRDWIIPLTSLAIAIMALSYSAWRDELSEQNRNVRVAGFEIIKELSALQLVSHYAYYDQNDTQGNPIIGWKHILLIEDMAIFMPLPVREQASKLHKQWTAHVDQLAENKSNNDAVVAEILNTQKAVLASLKALY
jgi:hypothetical protein